MPPLSAAHPPQRPVGHGSLCLLRITPAFLLLISGHRSAVEKKKRMASEALNRKYSYMGGVVRTLPTTDMTRVFRSADVIGTKDTSRLFFPWLGLNASEFGIGKLLCSMSHSISTPSRCSAPASSPKRPAARPAARSSAEGVDSILNNSRPSPDPPLRRSKRISKFHPSHGGFMQASP